LTWNSDVTVPGGASSLPFCINAAVHCWQNCERADDPAVQHPWAFVVGLDRRRPSPSTRL
jgi:hypothetical protein